MKNNKGDVSLTKLIGFLIILFSSSKIGIDVSRTYRCRTRELRSLITAFELLKNEITFTKNVAGRALFGASTVSVPIIKSMFKGISERIINEHVTASEAFEGFLKENIGYFSLNKADFEILREFFANFGSHSPSEEVESINNIVARLSSNLESAETSEGKYSRLFATSGVLCGFFIAILFI